MLGAIKLTVSGLAVAVLLVIAGVIFERLTQEKHIHYMAHVYGGPQKLQTPTATPVACNDQTNRNTLRVQ